MNTFDTIHLVLSTNFETYAPNELVCKSQISYDKTGSEYYHILTTKDGLNGTYKIVADTFVFYLNLSSKIYGNDHSQLISKKTIGRLLQELQTELYPYITMENLLESTVRIIHVTKDIPLTDDQLSELGTLRFRNGIRTLFHQKTNKNVSFTNDLKKENELGLYLTVYNKYEELRLAKNKEFRKQLQSHYENEKDVYRIETKLNGYKQIRLRLTNDFRFDNDFDNKLIEPQLKHCLESQENTLWYDLSYLIENTMNPVATPKEFTDTENYVSALLEMYGYDKRKVMYRIIDQHSKGIYDRRYRKILKELPSKLIDRKRTALHEIRDFVLD